MRRTATTAHAILGLLALRPRWSAWDMRNQLRRNMRFFWPRAESRILDELRNLDEQGLAKSSRSYTGRRARTEYAITRTGRARVRKWMATPPRPTSLECEPLLRVLLADLGDHDSLRAAIEQIRSDADAVLAVGRVIGAEYIAGTAPFQEDVHARALVFDFLSHYALALRGWAERADATVARWPAQDDDQRVAAALRTIKRAMAKYPAAPEAAPPAL